MKNLLILLGILVLTACGKGGGNNPGGATPAVPVDSAPHDYVVSIFSPDGSASSAVIHQLCNQGEIGFRDETNTLAVDASTPSSGSGCGGVVNISSEVQALTGTVYIEITIDGVWHPELEIILSPSQTYTFERGL